MRTINTFEPDNEKWQAIDVGFVQQLISSVTDNHGATLDRYTIFFKDDSYLTLSHNPHSPQGVSMWGDKGRASEDDEQITFEALPDTIQQHVIGCMRAAYEEFILDNPLLSVQATLLAILNGHKDT
jgi:hypothetical protein